MYPQVLSAEVSDAELIRSIEGAGGPKPKPRVIGLQRQPFAYASSATLERITAIMSDGSEAQFVLKHPDDMSEHARRTRPAFVLDAQREIEVYRRLLTPMQVGPRVIGSAVSKHGDDCWLLLDQIDGCPLQEAEDPQSWILVARSLAEMHRRFATLDMASLQHDARLLTYGRGWYALWLDRARRFFSFQAPVNSRRTSTSLRWLADRYDKVIEHLRSLPNTIIHGDFHPSNILLTRDSDPSVIPVDWEMAAIGPGIVDLAALTSGHWSDRDRHAVIAAYVGTRPGSKALLDDTMESVAYAQIHLAVQWLGWFGRRQAPAGQARDWLADAVDRAEALNL